MRKDHTLPRGELHRLQHKSVVLEGNPQGDPTAREIHVWTPPGWTPDETLPLLVDLTGYWGAGPGHTNWKNYSENVPERLDRLVAEGMPRVVAAFPDCFTKLYGNQYLNSAGSGRYADYICDEVVATVESKFKCGGKGRRGVFGKSSGGYGAAWHGLNRSDFWDAISINSGDMGFDALYQPTLYDDVDQLRKFDYSIEKWVRHVESQPKLKDKDRMILMDFAQSAFYDPDPSAFRCMQLPLDPRTGEFIPERWNNWMAHDPVVMFDTLGENLRKLKLIYMDCGWSDQFRIHFGMRRFAKKLTAAGIAHTYEEYDDDHSDVDYRMDVFLPLMAKALS
ncbi:alpha/beta hydrolase-fold protein [Terricaulis silvestris]|uniref:Putative hydrolase of the alpha/beta superfamily protein n=1 Tax=Terricaulis silvestris TaxID=2686094 RepID=A0A6I6MY77_9CAUL|nr:alpha/beta hydrolase-fold protein [Terricaulis silvestris]QGZ96113.1 putative hydrolase of the alpha/beta superfamily protein [Terricaulis silvestris]